MITGFLPYFFSGEFYSRAQPRGAVLMGEINYMAEFGARLITNGYSILPIAPGTKKPGRYRSGAWGEFPGWPQYGERQPTDLEVATWSKWPGAGIGVVGGSVAAVDIDIVEDPDLAFAVEKLCREHLGDSPALRIGRAPKRLLVYRAATPFKGIKRHPLEVLCAGQQFVAYAVHPDTGAPYVWPEEGLADLDIDSLPEISEAQALALRQDLCDLQGQVCQCGELQGLSTYSGAGHDYSLCRQGRCQCGGGFMSRRQTAPARIIKATRRWLGTPYHDQASVRGVGCDCLGLIRGVWREVVGPEPMPVPPYSRDWGETGPVEVLAEAARAAMVELEVSEARTGDVILFRMRAGAIAKHAGIRAGKEDVISADEMWRDLED